ncbi:MAG TPA: DoxX family protein [Dinghuibacter sp.]|jgi:hypothetical protein|uniref:DoxX family protein n=1 Tax=Dinghuibacter sp. TaxID=2024697 RepID=UPI002D1AA25C|nr:DoxX family protein [Dinghuibacter sp.]HTJ14764.1 DoxX family protein [Dinghuibacter sp.]
MTTKGLLRTGWIISGVCVLFLLFDAISKIAREVHTIQASQKLGWPPEHTPLLGVLLLVCTLLYVYPRTFILGALLLTAYLGGAVAIMWRAGENFVFPIVFGILVWASVYLREPGLREHLPVKK